MSKKFFIFLSLLIFSNIFASNELVLANNNDFFDQDILDLIRLTPNADMYEKYAYENNRAQILQHLKKEILESNIDDVQILLNKIKLTYAEKDYLYSLASEVLYNRENEEHQQLHSLAYKKEDYPGLELGVATVTAASLCVVYAGKVLSQALLPKYLNLFHQIIRFQAIVTIPMLIYMVLWAQTIKTIRLAYRLYILDVTIMRKRANKICDLISDLETVECDGHQEVSLHKYYQPSPSIATCQEVSEYEELKKQLNANLYKDSSSAIKALIWGAITTACFSEYMFLK